MCSNSNKEPSGITGAFSYYFSTRKVLRMLFNPIWAYWAPGSFLLLSQHTNRDAPPWGTWIRTLHWWRKVGKDGKKKKKAQHSAVFEPTTSRLQCMCYTAVPQPCPKCLEWWGRLYAYEHHIDKNYTLSKQMVFKRYFQTQISYHWLCRSKKSRLTY